MSIKKFIERHYHHFNARVLREAAESYVAHLQEGNKMMVTIAGAMSTARLGISLAEMIRQDKIHAITCTGANLEEDIYNLIGRDEYRDADDYRDLTGAAEENLYQEGFNRVTDTCIPEKVMLEVNLNLVKLYKKAQAENKSYFPHEYFFQLIEEGVLKPAIDPKESWLWAAYEKKIPLFVPGWEDSTSGNYFVARVYQKEITHNIMKNGLQYMEQLVHWYQENTKEKAVGFFQIGGGIAGDFPICVAPLLTQDMKVKAKRWGYFCQISDSTTSYGSYSGAVPNEKITWGKINGDTPRFIIESDATIVAPLIFEYILES